jgi:hypothetical protein
MAIWNISWRFESFRTIWYIFSGFGIMHQEKSGNPDSDRKGVKPCPEAGWVKKSFLIIKFPCALLTNLGQVWSSQTSVTSLGEISPFGEIFSRW